jgi:hypothetical protein
MTAHDALDLLKREHANVMAGDEYWELHWPTCTDYYHAGCQIRQAIAALDRRCPTCHGTGAVLDAPLDVLDGHPYPVPCENCTATLVRDLTSVWQALGFKDNRGDPTATVQAQIALLHEALQDAARAERERDEAQAQVARLEHERENFIRHAREDAQTTLFGL